MDIEFHCYMMHLIEVNAVFRPNAAYPIACAIQYSDDNVTPSGTEGGYAVYESVISQTILNPQVGRLDVARGDW